MIKSIGSFVKKKMADATYPGLPPQRPPRTPPPRPPLPKEFQVVQDKSFDTESDITEVLTVFGEAVEEQDLDEVLDFIDSDVYDTAEESGRVLTVNGTSKCTSPDGPSPDRKVQEKSKDGAQIAVDQTNLDPVLDVEKEVIVEAVVSKETHVSQQMISTAVTQQIISTEQVLASLEAGLSQQVESIKASQAESISQQLESTETLQEVNISQLVESAETLQEVNISQQVESAETLQEVNISQQVELAETRQEVNISQLVESAETLQKVNISQQVESAKTLQEVNISQQVESAETLQEVTISQQVESSEVSKELLDAQITYMIEDCKELNLDGNAEKSESNVETDLDSPSTKLDLVDKKGSVHASKESIMAELESAWGSVETSAIQELQSANVKAGKDVSFCSEKAGVSGTLQTIYVAKVSQVSKVYIAESATSEVPQRAEVTCEIIPTADRDVSEDPDVYPGTDRDVSEDPDVYPGGTDGDVSEDPDYAENTDIAEDADYTEEETEDELFKRESDFWEIDFDKYMDALLADLQNTITPGGTAPGTPHPAHNGTLTPSPGPSPGPSPNATLIHNHIHNRNGHDEMYHQERVEEVRSEQRSSGGGTKMSLNNNLSELDTLLQDLNNARYTGVFKEPPETTNGTITTTTVVNGSRPSVDSLLDELNSVDTSREIVEQRTVTHEVRTTNLPVSTPHPLPPPAQLEPLPPAAQASASSATKELDDLMASLSDFKKGDLTELEKQIIQEEFMYGQANMTSAVQVKKETRRRVAKMEQRSSEDSESDYSSLTRRAPPRPPPPQDVDILAVPPPRPPVPRAYSASPLPSEAYLFGSPMIVPAPSGVGRRHYIPRQHLTNNPLEDPFHRPPSGGPVKRNDAEYRWVTDANKYEVREVIDFPCVTEKINASSLQTQVDSAYAKPQKPKSPSPPTPTPTPPTPTPTPPKEPTPPPVNQLDCMLGSLATHMTEQGITTTQKGCCCACDKPIVGQVITALGKTWHPEHFTCTHCNQELGTRNFFERDGKPYCEVDYHNLFSPRCAYCNGPILDKCVTALDKTWHPDHFFCAQCGNTFGDDGFHEKDGKPYCRNDYFNMFAPKCGGCNAPIMDNYISALNAQWHPECFVCRDCRQPFNGGSFFDHEGLPYCETHYHAKRGSLCAGCHKPITGRCITAMFRKFHPEHFVCSFCLKQLNKGTFKEQNDKPYCHGCFDKLFG